VSTGRVMAAATLPNHLTVMRNLPAEIVFGKKILWNPDAPAVLVTPKLPWGSSECYQAHLLLGYMDRY
jgi:hypothetical protein